MRQIQIARLFELEQIVASVISATSYKEPSKLVLFQAQGPARTWSNELILLGISADVTDRKTTKQTCQAATWERFSIAVEEAVRMLSPCVEPYLHT